jgi:single-stranded-DNA-specific exonuclease
MKDERERGRLKQSAPPTLAFPGGLPKGIAGLLAAKCIERFRVPSIALAPSQEPGVAVGSGRSVAGFNLAEALEQFRGFFKRFGGHAQAVGLSMPIGEIGVFAKGLLRGRSQAGS